MVIYLNCIQICFKFSSYIYIGYINIIYNNLLYYTVLVSKELNIYCHS